MIHPANMPTMRVDWSRLSGMRTPALMVLGLAALVLGAFLIYTPAGFIVLGAALIFMAYVTDDDEGAGSDGRTT